MKKRKQFCTLLGYDVYKGIGGRYKLYLAALCVILFSGWVFATRLAGVMDSAKPENLPGILDFVMNILGGNLPADRSGGRIDIPMDWLLFHTILAAIPGFYVREDMSRSAYSLMLRVNSKEVWWNAKCIWCMLAVTFYYAVFAIVAFGFTIVCGDTSQISNGSLSNILFQVNSGKVSAQVLWMLVFFVPMLISWALLMAQMVIGLLIKPMYAFMLQVAFLVGAAFYSNPFLVWNYTMISREQHFMPGSPIRMRDGCLIAVGLLIGNYVAGRIVMKKKDIL